jgi:hypothetical protein
MVGRKPRDELDIMVVKILEVSPSLGYNHLEDIINLACQGLGLKKPSTRTFWIHMTNLRDRGVLDREKDRYGGTHYSLKKDFKDSMEKKIDYPSTYIEKALQEFSTIQYPSDEKPIEIINESSEDKKT